MKYCNRCGSACGDGTNFCPVCGARLDAQFAPQYGNYGYMPPYKQKKKRSRTASFFLMLLKGLGFLALLFGVETIVTLLYQIIAQLFGWGENYLNAAIVISYVIVFALSIPLYKTGGESLFKGVRFKKISLKTVIGALLLGVVSQVFFETAFMFLPLQNYMQQVQEQNNMLTSGPLWLQIVSIAVFTPFIEEVMFRGILYGELRKYSPKWLAAVLSAVIFGACHGSWIGFIYASILGILFCFVYERTGSIFTSMLIHAGFNGVTFVLNHIFFSSDTIYYIALLLMSLGAAILIIWAMMHRDLDEDDYLQEKGGKVLK